MAAIDLIVLGMLKQASLSAYDLQKLVEYRNISRWVKISTPSIYKKVLQLETKGYLSAHVEKEGKMPEKTVYTLTEAGEAEFERLMLEISGLPVRLFLDFNAVIVNLESLPEMQREECICRIEDHLMELKACLSENLALKADSDEVPPAGKAVLRQQFALVQALEEWVGSLRADLGVLPPDGWDPRFGCGSISKV